MASADFHDTQRLIDEELGIEPSKPNGKFLGSGEAAEVAITLGLNQTILMVLSVVIIAGLTGSGALGVDVVYGLTKGELGLGVEAGIAIVALAVVLDRMTQGWVAGAPRVGARRASPQPMRAQGTRVLEEMETA